MRFEYLMKQLSVCVQKWRSTYLNHGLKYRTLDAKPAAPIRIGNLPLLKSTQLTSFGMYTADFN